jgi:hypothetical protein
MRIVSSIRFRLIDSRATRSLVTGTGALSARRAAVVVAACLLEAVVVLGFVVASLGIGAEDQYGIGPDRPPPPTTPKPESPPDQRPGLTLAGFTNERSLLSEGRGK